MMVVITMVGVGLPQRGWKVVFEASSEYGVNEQ